MKVEGVTTIPQGSSDKYREAQRTLTVNTKGDEIVSSADESGSSQQWRMVFNEYRRRNRISIQFKNPGYVAEDLVPIIPVKLETSKYFVNEGDATR